MSAALLLFLLRTQERVRNSRGERVISVQVTEVLLYIHIHDTLVGLFISNI